MKYLLYILICFSVIGCNSSEKKTLLPHKESLKDKYEKSQKFLKQNKLGSFLSEAREIENTAKRVNNFYYLSHIYSDIAEYYFAREKYDSSYIYYEAARENYQLIGDSSNIVKTLLKLSKIHYLHSDFMGAEVSLLNAIKLIPKAEYAQLSSDIYFQMGENEMENHNPENAAKWYLASLKDSTYSQDYYKHVRLASAYLSQNKQIEAQQIIRKLSKNPEVKKDFKTYASTLDINANIEFIRNPNNVSVEDYLIPLEIRLANHDLNGLYFSYRNLTNYFKKLNNIPEARKYTYLLYEVAKKQKNTGRILVSLQFLIDLETPEKAQEFAQIYTEYIEKETTDRAKIQNSFARIKFDIEKKRHDNERLKKQQIEKQIKIQNKKTYFYIFILLALIVISISSYQYKIQKARNNKKLLEEIHKTEQQISSKIHDEIANNIYQTLSLISGKDIIHNYEQKKYVVDQLDEVYQLARDISRENQKIQTDENYPQEIYDLIAYFKDSNTNIILLNFKEKPWLQMREEIKIQFFKILKELLNFSKNTSKASLVTLSFEFDKNNFNFKYADNSKDINILSSFRKNIQNRTFILYGKVKRIESGSGLKLFFTFPYAKVKKINSKIRKTV